MDGDDGGDGVGGLKDAAACLCDGFMEGMETGLFLKHLTSAGAERWRICNHLYREERWRVSVNTSALLK